ncbi:histone-fold-containing protein [Gonapodya prolifera JEL478]|uniref:Histone-fold-containing protein n=1 Tax=Gonapodya prolifera (strain JEL478) TaxID=1344416 RepID=A0A139AC59_GONPJ|nr:histone-fold-containing protein [Gonapodya prolifera JEL478]|eukprot:KXS14347.1 histone-fold-containing protein [Gonapodya prolifera JEL478]
MASTSLEDLKSHSLPIARVKKVMRSDEDAMKNLMISGETPMLLAKAAEIFIEEMTLRAWMHAEEDRRRTLNRSDFAQAVARSDMFDFLIDIVPRDEEWIRGNSAVVEAEAGPNGNNGLPSVSSPFRNLRSPPWL